MKTLTRFLDPSRYLQLVRGVWAKGKKRRGESQEKIFLNVILSPSVMFTLCVGFFILGGIQGIGVYLLLLGCMFFIDLAADEKML